MYIFVHTVVAAQTECQDGAFYGDMDIPQWQLSEEMEKLQDLSFNSFRRKLFEAPFEPEGDTEATSVDSVILDDGHDRLMVSNKGIKVRYKLLVSR